MDNIGDILESNVLMNVRKEINETESKDTINKIYRQARTWVRFHWYFANGCDSDHAKELNNKLKHIRWARLKELGYIVKEEK